MSTFSKLSGSDWITFHESDQMELKGYRKISNEASYFRCTFTLNAKAILQFSVSAISRYRLWVNGKPVGSGPCKGDRWRHYYETLDLSKFLQEGANIIAAKVVAYAPYESQSPGASGPLSVWTNGAGPCFIASGCCIDEAGEVLADVSTRREGGGEWKVCRDEAMEWELYSVTHFLGAMERVHGGRIPANWNLPVLNPGGEWRKPEYRWPAEGGLFGVIPPFPLKERPIPLLYEKEKSFAKLDGSSVPAAVAELGQEGIAIPPNSIRRLVWDAGELTTGYVRLTVSGGMGAKLKLLYAECYAKPQVNALPIKERRDDAENGELIGHTDVYWPSGKAKTESYEPFWFRTFRYVQVEVETADEEIRLAPLSYRETGYPLEVTSRVESHGTDWIRPLWDVSVRTLARCMHETYEDCPYYEQLQYTMDTRLQILFTFAISGDTRLAARAIEDYHASLLPEGILQSRYPSLSAQVIPGFSLQWILMLEDYYEQTGDAGFTKRYRPTMDAVLEWYDRKIGGQGLVEHLGYWEYFDWVSEWKGNRGVPLASQHGPSTLHNLLYIYALRSAARLSRLTGRNDTAAEYETRADAIATCITTLCWDEKQAFYREGPAFNQITQHAQVWAVLAGVIEGEAAESLLIRMLQTENLPKCSYAMSFYLFRALEQVGLYARTESLWKPWRELIELGLTTWPENPNAPRSDCHAWGALPLYEFTHCLLGVKPGEPGWGSILIEPKGLTLQDLKGEVITPKGNVRVTWIREGGIGVLEVETPKGTPAVIVLPNRVPQVLQDGGAFCSEMEVFQQ
jgi:hypothetical protein